MPMAKTTKQSKDIEVTTEVKVPKKRGRKSKKELAEIARLEAEKNQPPPEINENDSINDVLSKISQKADKAIELEKAEEQNLPKKRGRKAKNKVFEFSPPKPKDDEQPKKRGRKPKEKFGQNEQPEEITEDYILLQLPIHTKDLEEVEFTSDKMFRYSDKISPEPSFSTEGNDYQKVETKNQPTVESLLNLQPSNLPPSVPDLMENNVTKIIREKPKPVEFTKQELQKRFENIKERKPGVSYENRQNRQVKLMTQFRESSRRGEWPQQTKLYCFWCCHSFESIPWGIPVKYNNGIFHVDGNFCSPECAAAYNYEQKDFNMWERYALLNLLYNKVNYPKYQKLKLAPPRRLLIEYGGNMSIDDFRKYCNNYTRDYMVNFPPLVAVPTIAEEVNLSEHYRQKVIYMDQKRIDEASRRCQEQHKELMEQDKSLYRCFDRIATMNV